MVWFPGGAFLVGSASTYEGSELAAREKVVLVFLQYRLGILGFFRWALDQGRGLHLPARDSESGGTGGKGCGPWTGSSEEGSSSSCEDSGYSLTSESKEALDGEPWQLSES